MESGLSWREAVCLSKTSVRQDLAVCLQAPTSSSPPLADAPCTHLEEGPGWICELCKYGGELILCDRCNCGFHAKCLGVDSVRALPDVW